MLICIYGMLIYTAVPQVDIFLKEIGVKCSYIFEVIPRNSYQGTTSIVKRRV